MGHLLVRHGIEWRRGGGDLQQKCLILNNCSWKKICGASETLKLPEGVIQVSSSPLQLAFIEHLWTRSYAVLYVLSHLIPTKIPRGKFFDYSLFKDKETESQSWGNSPNLQTQDFNCSALYILPCTYCICQLQGAQVPGDMLYVWKQHAFFECRWEKQSSN